MNAVAALLVAVCVSVLTAIALAFCFAGLGPVIAAVSLCAGGVIGLGLYCSCVLRRKKTGAMNISGWDWFVIVVFALFSLRAFCWLVFRNGDQIQILSPNNLGDLALHITYTSNLAQGVPFWPANPIFAGSKIHYPLGIDLFNSLLVLAGVDIYRGLIWVGLASCLLTGVAFYKWGRGFALAGFLFNGGLAGFSFFSRSGFSLKDFQADLAWKSIPLSMFVTQRGLLYAIPAGLALLWSWRERFFSSKPANERQPLPFWVEFLLYSTMPLFHLHAFIFLSLLLGSWLVWSAVMFVWNLIVSFFPEKLRPGFQFPGGMTVLALVACSFIPATVIIALITGCFKSTSLVHFASDWMYGDQSQFNLWAKGFGLPAFFTGVLGHIACWLVNYGLLPFLIVELVCRLFRRRHEPASINALAFVVPSVLIFIFSYYVMLAPWDWDNTKIMIWPYFAILPFLWDYEVAACSLLVRGACCFLLFFSGFVTLLGGIDGSFTGFDFASSSENAAVATAVRQLPATAIFAAFPTYNHPLSLDGRDLVAGYPGHLWSHGIDSKEQLDKLDSLLNGEDGWRQTARELHADYLFWGDREGKAYPDSTKPWETTCPKIAQGSWGAIYDLQKQLPPSGAH